MTVHITRCEVDWCDQFDNAPSLKVFLDTDPFQVVKEILYEVLEVVHAGIDLSADQVAVIGESNAKPKLKTVVYGEHPCGMVRWIVSGEPPGGAGAGEYPLEDGSKYRVQSGWYVGPSVCHAAGKGPILACGFYIDQKKRQIGLGGAGVLLDVISEPPLWPEGVQVLDGNLAWAGRPSKKAWREQERERLAPLWKALCDEYGLESESLMLRAKERSKHSFAEEEKMRQKLMNDSRWAEATTIRPYGELGPA